MNEFVFDEILSPWDIRIGSLRRGMSIHAGQVLALVRDSDNITLTEALEELREKGVELDLRGLPSGAGTMFYQEEQQLALEERIAEKGNWQEALPEGALRDYLTETGRLALREDGAELARSAGEGDVQARNRLVEGYLEEVFFAAAEFCGRGVLMMDLIQDGSMGLIQSVAHYSGGQFRPHARWWIRQYIAGTLVERSDDTGIVDSVSEQMRLYQQAEKNLTIRLGRMPMEEEIAVEMGFSADKCALLGKMIRDARQYAKQDPRPEEDAEPEQEQAVENTADYHAKERVSELMTGLTEEETAVLNLRYGLGGKAPMTVEQTARKLGLPRERIPELEKLALEKMRGAQ